MRTGAACLAALALLAAPAVHAAGEAVACGGVGAEERAALKAREGGVALKLLFVTAKRGGWLADAEVAVADARGAELLRTRADGPICHVSLPEGRYRITAVFAGATRAASVAVPAKPAARPQQVVFAFPAEPWDGIWASDEEKRQARE